MALEATDRLRAYLLPAVLLLIAVFAGIATVIDLVLVQRRPQDVLTYSKWRDDMFGRAWKLIGPTSAASEVTSPVPSLVSSARGVVVELGPGSGLQIPRLDPTKITRVYGIEPCVPLHAELRKQIENAGLRDVYEIVPLGIEDAEGLKKYGIESGGVDTIMSIKCLCCVPEPERVARILWGLLKPGGTLLMSEHVKSKDWLGSSLQELYNLVWPTLLANCHLNRPTLEYLMRAGEWQKVELLPYGGDGGKPFAVVPYVCGRLVKG